MLNAAVIGVGAMGKNHARVYSDLDSVRLVAIADSKPEALVGLSKKYNCNTYIDYRKMFSSEKIDVVSIAVQTKFHKEIASYAINKGVNILLEKPIASSVNDAKDIIDLANTKGIKLMIGHIERFNPAIIELKRRLENNELGAIYKIDLNRVGPFPPRVNDVGVVVDLAIHDLDLVRYLTNSEVKRICSETCKKIHSTNEDLLKALMRLKSGALCTISVDWLTPTKIRTAYVTGEKGMFFADYLTQDLYFFENAVFDVDKANYSDLVRGVIEGKMTKFLINKKEPLTSEIESFINCINNNSEPTVTGNDGLKALELAQKVLTSANSY